MGCVDVKFEMGKRSDGKPAGNLFIRFLAPGNNLSKPAGLKYSKGTAPGDVQLIRSGGVLRQAKGPQVLADIVPDATNPDYKYEIRFYDKNNWGTFNSTTELYESMGSTFVVWVIENPDGASANNRLLVSKRVADTCKTLYVYEYTSTSATEYTWTMTSGACGGSPLRTESKASVVDGSTRTDTHLIYEGSDVIYQAVETWTTYGWGVPVMTHSEIGTSNKIIIDRVFYTVPPETDSTQTGKYGKLKSWKKGDGTWLMRDYDDKGRKILEISGYKGVTMPTSISENTGHAIINDYTPISGQGDYGTAEPYKPRVVTEKIEGTVVSKTYYTYVWSQVGDKWRITEIEQRCPDTLGSCSYSYPTTNNLTTVRVYFPEDVDGNLADRTISVTHPDGRKDTYAYAEGTYTPHPTDASQPGSFCVPGESGCPSTTSNVRTKVTHEGPSGPVTDKTTEEIIYTDLAGNELLHENYVRTSSSYDRFEYTVNVFDGAGHLTDTYKSNGTQVSQSWSDCCGLTASTDITGLLTEFTYDAIGRKTRANKKGVSQQTVDSVVYPAQGDIYTDYTRVGTTDGLKETTTISDSGASLSISSFVQYDKAKRIKTVQGTDGTSTEYAYAYDTGGDGHETVTITHPSTKTEITEYYLDRKIKSITGTGVVNKFYYYGVNTDGTQWTQIKQGASGAQEWVETTTYDVLDRVKKIERPGFDGNTLTITHTYTKDKLTKTVSSGPSSGTPTITTCFEYDADTGELFRSGVDRGDTAGALDLNSTDRITETISTYDLNGSDWWRLTETKVYASDSSSSTTTVSTVKQRLEGLTGGVIEETITYAGDTSAPSTTTTVTINRGSGDVNRLVTRIVNMPESDTDEKTAIRNGLLQWSQSRTALITNYGYDAVGRQNKVTDARGNDTETFYYAATASAGSKNNVESVKNENSDRTCFTYDSAGRQASIRTGANGSCGDGKRQYFSYTDRGELYRTWGETTYPVEYGYDACGRKTSMKTYRGAPTSGSWTADTWPTPNSSTTDTTQWIYYSGMLTMKIYGGNYEVAYEYTDDGRISKRIWSRHVNNDPLQTEYSYNSTSGDLTGVNYADSTPDLTNITYDRLGRQTAITDAVGTRTFAYNSDLQLNTETIDGDSGSYDKTITRNYEPSGTNQVLGRPNGFTIGSEYTVEYDYDAKGRIEKITGPGLPAGGVFYERLKNGGGTVVGDAVEYIKYKDGSANVVAKTQRQYEPYRDLIDFIENKAGTSSLATVSKYDYENDEFSRRKNVVYTSSPTYLATTFVSDHHVRWTYNDRNELTNADRCTGVTTTGGCTAMSSNYNYDYAYDPIGNRTSSTVDTTSRTYTSNNLNQYSSITNPSDSFTYDYDGNMTQDGTFDYTWDAENRLIKVETRLSLGANETEHENDDKKVEFKYDYMSRRVQKKASHWASSAWVLDTDQRFVYDQWNVVLVVNSSNTTTKKYTWGLDLSGQGGDTSTAGIHGAGGIGGLLAVEETAESGSPTYWFAYDANGNVGQVIKSSDCSVVAQYEYDSYGSTITLNGSYAATNTFRFSTKWFDSETTLSYYGYRYYSRNTGRWLNRDTIGEEGGLNLYVFVKNEPIKYYDPHGLKIGGCDAECQKKHKAGLLKCACAKSVAAKATCLACLKVATEACMACCIEDDKAGKCGALHGTTFSSCRKLK